MSRRISLRRGGKVGPVAPSGQPEAAQPEAVPPVADPLDTRPTDSPAAAEPASDAEPASSPAIDAGLIDQPNTPDPRDPEATSEAASNANLDAGDNHETEPEAEPEPAGAPEASVGTGRDDAISAAPPTMADRLAELAGYGHVVLSWIAGDGYPMNVDAEVEISPEKGTVRFSEPVGFKIAAGSVVALTGSHIQPLPGGGFDQRRHLTIWGIANARPRGRFVLSAERVWAWDGEELPLPAVYERDLPKARRYFERLSAARGVTVRPRLSPWLLFVRATRAPFLSATLVPVILGLAVALRLGYFDLLTALLTVVAACAVHLGLNVANDVFDTLSGADDANTTPTMFSGGSRVLQNALISIRGMSALAASCYLVAAAIGLALFVLRGSPALVAIAVIGLFISLAYTMPPFKLVYRGAGEVATAIGFGPVMLLGAFVVQSRGVLSLEAFVVSIPVALLVAMILYVNEIPDRPSDAKAGKLTLPVRWSKAAVIRGFDVSAGSSFAVVVLGVAAGVLPIPALLVLAAIPIAVRVHRGLVTFYDDPYAMMAAMGANIRLHLTVGLLLLAGYAATLADQAMLGRGPFLWK